MTALAARLQKKRRKTTRNDLKTFLLERAQFELKQLATSAPPPATTEQGSTAQTAEDDMLG